MTSNKQKQLTINLDEIKNPHKEILRAYKEADAEFLYYRAIPENVNEERLFLQHTASGVPIRHLITHLYRKQLPSGKQFCFFAEELFCRDFFKNSVMHFRTVGKYELPVIEKTMGLNQGRIVGNTDINKMMEAAVKEVSIDHFETIYEFPWEDIKPILVQWKQEGIITDETQMYVIVGNNKYGKPYTWEEWLNLDISDLVLLSRAGSRYQELLKGVELTPEILAELRKKLQSEVLTEIAAAKK